MENFFNNIMSSIGITDVLDILIVAFLVYTVLRFIRETRAEQLAKGLLVLVIGTAIADLTHLYTVHWILSNVMTVGMIAVVVLFQPELRRALEKLGRAKLVRFVGDMDKDEAKNMVVEIAKAIESMSQSKTGALMVIERETTLNDIIETGTVIDAAISAEMIGNIFYEGAPLHDGAMILRGDRLYAAGCVLPLTQNKKLSKELGTRHRAGIGVTETSDALVIIVSEETGVVSLAENGQLTRFIDIKRIEKILLTTFLQEEQKGIFTDAITRIFRGGKNAE
ncbi:MAG: diadenylate cyclase CdaA [Firmicutes bacterium]|nr:diadenylate cyclase CdaA [Bacillota bacterium]